MSPARAADRQYQKAIESHFDLAHRLVRQGEPDRAEVVAIAAARLRWFAATEVSMGAGVSGGTRSAPTNRGAA